MWSEFRAPDIALCPRAPEHNSLRLPDIRLRRAAQRPCVCFPSEAACLPSLQLLCSYTYTQGLVALDVSQAEMVAGFFVKRRNFRIHSPQSTPHGHASKPADFQNAYLGRADVPKMKVCPT